MENSHFKTKSVWWMDDDKFWVKKGKWRVKEDVPSILAHHRELIVKEIREEIEGIWTGTAFSTDLKGSLVNDGFNQAKECVLSLPCLKENE